MVLRDPGILSTPACSPGRPEPPLGHTHPCYWGLGALARVHFACCFSLLFQYVSFVSAFHVPFKCSEGQAFVSSVELLTLLQQHVRGCGYSFFFCPADFGTSMMLYDVARCSFINPARFQYYNVHLKLCRIAQYDNVKLKCVAFIVFTSTMRSMYHSTQHVIADQWAYSCFICFTFTCW